MPDGYESIKAGTASLLLLPPVTNVERNTLWKRPEFSTLCPRDT